MASLIDHWWSDSFFFVDRIGLVLLIRSLQAKLCYVLLEYVRMILTVIQVGYRFKSPLELLTPTFRQFIALSTLLTALQCSTSAVSWFCDQSLYLSINRRKNRHGHWVCCMSTGIIERTVSCEEHTSGGGSELIKYLEIDWRDWTCLVVLFLRYYHYICIILII